MSDRGPSVDDIKAMLTDNIERLAEQLAPGGYRAGNYYFALNPTRVDRHIGSFWITVRGQYAGAWVDRATSELGSVLDLIAYVNRFGGTRSEQCREACIWAKDWLGLEKMDPARVRKIADDRARDRALAEKKAAADLASKRRRAFAVWLDARKDLRGTVAETYLASRGIDLARFERMPRALRFAPEMKHAESGRTFPTIVAAMTDAAGTIVAVHRTFLAADGSGKAPVDPPRKIWPSFAGASIRLWRGETGLSPSDAFRDGLVDKLAICEGVEDGLSVALAFPELRVWSAGSLSNLANVVPPPSADEVIVCADNDWGKPAAQAQLDRALQALAASGVKVSVARSMIGKDFNDQLRGAA